MVQKELSKGGLEENTLVDGFANEHAEEFEVLLVIFDRVLREGIGIQSPFLISLREECVLRVEDLLRHQGHELFEQTATIHAHLGNFVLVHELNPECVSRVLLVDY